ncbi:MAG TPA: hypothetical protein VJL33_00955 [Candidatus Bathyarchaeia archaeon]|nr:hypothetical protein [Candidatus Bathyarchaeia archaeon]
MHSLRRDKRAFSPAVSSIIMIAAVMVMILVAMSYASTVLDSRLAENEFSANKQFILATGLQIDDVAWTVGRTQTISYSSRFGHVKYQTLALNYSVDLLIDSNWVTVFSNVTTGMIMYNMPINKYNLGNNYFERLSPIRNSSFLQEGSTAPVNHAFIVEQLPMTDGNYIRVAAVPSIRVLNSSIIGPSQSTSTVYYKFFLPTLEASSVNPALSQSVTMVGSDVTKLIRRDVDRVNITVSFPNSGIGFNSDFFKFEGNSTSTVLPTGSVVEFYLGKVVVSVGRV